MRASLRGAMTALATPFSASGELDVVAFERLVKRQIDLGIDGLVPCGTTGETPTLSTEEQEVLIGATVRLARAASRRVPVVVGTGSNSTRTTIAATRRARELGGDAALVVTPYYNKPTQEGLYRHFRAVAEESGLPVVLYNVPGRTGVDLQPETVVRLAKDVPLVVGLKEATADVARCQRLVSLLGAAGTQLALLSGEDGNVYPFIEVGGHGTISVTSNIDPAGVAGVCRAALHGDVAKARGLFYSQLPLHAALFLESNPIPLKAGLHMMGLCEDVLRLPLVPLSPEPRTRLRDVLKQQGLL
jgi:4-hydroxy-tetrahydrodipicolinate synthase